MKRYRLSVPIQMIYWYCHRPAGNTDPYSELSSLPILGENLSDSSHKASSKQEVLSLHSCSCVVTGSKLPLSRCSGDSAAAIV